MRRRLSLLTDTGTNSKACRGILVDIGTDVYLRKVVAQDQGEFLQLMRTSMDIHSPWITPPTTPQCFATTCSAYAEAITRAM